MSTTPNTDPLAAAMGPSGSFMPPAPAELAPHLPDLEIEALIGQGGMGAVYRVRQRADGKLLALKVVRPEVGKEAAFAARFAREAEALERLHHPNIVAIHGHGTAGPWCWLLMDLVEGANLREIVATGRLSPAQTLALVPPLCAALQYAHDQGVVHRDLKPENILLDAAGVPHLVDFGLAKLRDGAAGSDLTNTGAGMGTVHYMAPEQVASAKDVDHRADIYALGVVIYELLTGELPLGRFENPSQRAAVDARIDAVVLKALERDPQRRWQQMRQVGQAVVAMEGSPAVVGQAARTEGAAAWSKPDLMKGVWTAILLFIGVPLLPLSDGWKFAILALLSVVMLVWWCVVLVREGRSRMAWLVLGLMLGLLTVATAAGLQLQKSRQSSVNDQSRVNDHMSKALDTFMLELKESQRRQHHPTDALRLIERLADDMRQDPRVQAEVAGNAGHLRLSLADVTVSCPGLDAAMLRQALSNAFTHTPLELVDSAPPATVRLSAKLWYVEPDPSKGNTGWYSADLRLERITDRYVLWQQGLSFVESPLDLHRDVTPERRGMGP